MKRLFLLLTLLPFFLPANETRVEEGNRMGILHVGNGAEPESLDPHLTTGVPEYKIISALLEGLVRESGKDLEPIPGVAEEWTVSDDGLVYHFMLREDAKWSNGDPVTAEDFVFSFRRMLSPELGAEYAYLLYIIENAQAYNQGSLEDASQVGVQALSPQQLKIRLENPNPSFLNMLNHHAFYPVHGPTLKNLGNPYDRSNPWARPEHFTGNGPFTLQEWRLQERIVLQKSETYWDRESLRLNQMVFYPVEDEQTEERMFRSGLLHVTNSLPLRRITRYRNNHPELLYSHPYLATYYYLINTTRPPFDDVRVRTALALAVQRELITEAILQGGERPALWFTPPETGGFTPSGSLEESIERAQELLAEAGYPGGRGFPSFTLMYNTSEAHRTIAQVVQQQWRQHLGIRCELANREWQVYMLQRRNLDFDVARAGWAGDYEDPHNFLNLHTAMSGNNHTGWTNETYDELIAKAAAAADQAARFEYYDKAEALLLEEMPIIPVYWYTRTYLVQPSVRGWDPNLLDRRNYVSLWLEPTP